MGKTTKVIEIKSEVSERASILFRAVAIAGEVTNLQSMLFTKKGDAYMEYAAKFKKVDYPTLRPAIEIDLALAPTQQVDGILRGKPAKITVYPWGRMTLKQKASNLAYTIVKTYQRRALKFDKDHNKRIGVTVFDKFDKKANEGKGAVVNKTIDITYKQVHKSFDEKRALAFLNSFLVK